MSHSEKALRKYVFFEERQATWSSHFRDYVLGEGVDEEKSMCLCTPSPQSGLMAEGDGRSLRR